MFWSMLASATTSLLSYFLTFFPYADEDVVDLIDVQLDAFRGYLAGANWIFPVGDFFTLLSAVFLIESIYWIYRFSRYILNNISFGIFK